METGGGQHKNVRRLLCERTLPPMPLSAHALLWPHKCHPIPRQAANKKPLPKTGNGFLLPSADVLL